MELYEKHSQINWSFRGERYGKPWESGEKASVRILYMEGCGVNEICKLVQRPAAGVIPKLLEMRLIKHEVCGGYKSNYYRIVSPNIKPTAQHEAQPEVQQPEVQTEEENEMALRTKNIETVVMIRGVDASTKSDDEIFQLIATLEGEAANMGAIKNKPKKLEKKIEDLQADIQKLVEYVDSRE